MAYEQRQTGRKSEGADYGGSEPRFSLYAAVGLVVPPASDNGETTGEWLPEV